VLSTGIMLLICLHHALDAYCPSTVHNASNSPRAVKPQGGMSPSMYRN